MIEKPDAHRLSQFGNPARQPYVFRARLGRPRRVVVRENDALCANVEGPAQKPAQIALDMTGPALCEHLVGEIAPILRYEGRVQAFGGRLRDDTAKILAGSEEHTSAVQ